MAITLFLPVWGAKLAVIGEYGSDLPFWDQWEREGDHLYIPWFERQEWWGPLTAPHNEHRIVATLASNFGLVLLTGQWDARVQCVVSAAWHAMIVTLLFAWAMRHLPWRWAVAAGILLGGIASLPIGWENLLGGFQSQFYFLIGFSLLALNGLLGRRALSPGWWGGVGAGVLAVVSMGSGLLVGPVVVSVLVLRRVMQGQKEAGDRTTILVAMALSALGAILFNPIPDHAAFRAHGVTEFGVYFLRCLSWPLADRPFLALLIWAPWIAMVYQHYRGRNFSAALPATRGVEFVVAMGLWVLVQAAATAYSRGGTGELPASRYGDVFEVGIAAGVLALAVLSRSGRRVWMAGAAVVGLGIVVTMHVAAVRRAEKSLENKKADHAAYESSVRQFVLADDFATFEKQGLPFPNAGWIARILRTPCIRNILPVSVRLPLSVPGLASPESYGASASIKPLPHRATRALVNPGEWRSAGITPMKGWWKIETAGQLGAPGAALEIVAVRDGRVLGTVAPSKRAGRTWRAAYVRAPDEPAYLRARCMSAESWFAFSEPIAMSSASWYVWRACKQGWALAGLGWGLFAILAVAALYRGRLPAADSGMHADGVARDQGDGRALGIRCSRDGSGSAARRLCTP